MDTGNQIALTGGAVRLGFFVSVQVFNGNEGVTHLTEGVVVDPGTVHTVTHRDTLGQRGIPVIDTVIVAVFTVDKAIFGGIVGVEIAVTDFGLVVGCV